MSEIKQAIRKALVGSSSQKPVVAGMLSLSAIKHCPSATSEDVMRALEEMLDTREINTASVTKGGTTTVMYWLTGSIVLRPGPQGIRLDGTPTDGQRRPPFRCDLAVHIPKAEMRTPPANAQDNPAKVKPKTSLPTTRKEKAMSATSEKKPPNRSPITQALLDLVGEQPGISKATLIEAALKHSSKATFEQANKAIQNLVHSSKKIRMQLVDNERCYYLNDGTKPSSAKPDAHPAPAPQAKTHEGVDDGFSIMLSESGNLHVNTGVVTAVLTPSQVGRLHRFIKRINLDEGAV